MWSATIFDLQTGSRVEDVAISEQSAWGVGDLSERTAQIHLHDGYDDDPNPRDRWHEIVGKWWDRVLVFFWDGQPVAEGLIVDAPRFNRRTSMLTVTHIPVPSLLERRWMHGVGTSDGDGGYDPRGSFEVSGVSVAGAVVRVLQQAYTAAVSLRWPIPIQLPAVQEGGFSQTWFFHQFQDAATMINDLTEREDGPQMDQRPIILDDGRLSRVQRVGALTGPTFAVFLDAEESAAADANYGEYGRDTATGVHYPGNGEDEDMRVGAAFLPVSAGLARDTLASNKTESNVAKLTQLAYGHLKPRTKATQRWSLTVKTRKINPAELREGSTIIVYSDNSRWEPERTAATVVGFSGSCGETYTVELQDI